MIISHRVSKGNAIEYNISCKDELLSFINECLKPKVKWLDIGYDLNEQIKHVYTSTENITLKKWYNLWAPIHRQYSNQRTLQYWLIRGYTKDHATSNIKTLQSKAGNSFAKKIKDNPEMYTAINPTQIGYWLKKGYTEDEAIILISERQRTFSLDKCIAKWGLEEGTNRFNERNDRWLKSRKIALSEGKWNFKDQGSFKNSFDYFYKIYGDSWILHHISILKKTKRVSESYINELQLLHNLKYETNQLDNYLLSLEFDKIISIAKNSVLQYILSKTNIEIISSWCEFNKIKFKQNNRGNQYWYNNYFFKSNHEFSIGKYLIDNNINFKVNLRYPNLNFYYDFYLEDLDIYVEYMGMRDKDYSNKIEKLKASKFSIIWIKDIKELKQFINEKNNK